MKRPRIIVTRPQADALAFAAQASAAGFDPVISPVIRIVPRAFGLPPDTRALAFTSANGVRGYTGSRDFPVFAVGEKTAAAARAAGFATVSMAEGDAKDLSRLVREAHEAAPLDGLLVHLSGSETSFDLVGDLEAHSVPARRIIAYDADPAADLTHEAIAAVSGGGCWTALFSPRSARLFVELADKEGVTVARCGAACLSAEVWRAASARSWAAHAVAARRSAASLLAAVKQTRFEA